MQCEWNEYKLNFKLVVLEIKLIKSERRKSRHYGMIYHYVMLTIPFRPVFNFHIAPFITFSW